MDHFYQLSFLCPSCNSTQGIKVENHVKCAFCGNKYRANLMDEPLFVDLRIAVGERQEAKFDEARRRYDKMIGENPAGDSLEEAYWGRFLCEQYVIFYQNDAGDSIPSFWEINRERCENSKNYQMAVACGEKSGNADNYRRLASLIETYKEKYNKVKKEFPKGSEIFICFKDSGTTDRNLGYEIYNTFSKDYRVFFSPQSLNEIRGNDYEPYIYHALKTAKVMLVLCSSRDALESKWVHNEWWRFHSFAEGSDRTVIPIFRRGFDASMLPQEIKNCQGHSENVQLIATLGERLKRIFEREPEGEAVTEEVSVSVPPKKKSFKTALLAFLLLLLVGGAAFGASMLFGGSENKGLVFKTLAVNGTDVYGKVSNATEEFAFAEEIEVPEGVTFAVALDPYGIQTVLAKKVALEIGDNVFYLIEQQGEALKTYTVTVRRRPMHTVSFDASGGTAVDAQTVEEDGFAVAPQTTRVGYTFSSWSEELYGAIVKDTVITAQWTPNSYTVTYDPNGGEIWEESTQTVLYDGDYTPIGSQREGFEFAGWYHDGVKYEGGRWSVADDLTLVAQWTPVQCSLYVEGINGSVTGEGAYDYDSTVTVTATPYFGCDFLGWYEDWDIDENSVPLSVDLSYSFVMQSYGDMKLYARFELRQEIEDELADFGYRLSENAVEIYDVRDETKEIYTIPDYITAIADYTFDDCENLVSVVFSENSNLTSIGKYAFYGCTSLTSITIPKGVTSIGNLTFYGCNSLESVVFSENSKLTSIGEWAFLDCKSLTSITIPKGVTSIGALAFDGCNSLESVVLSENSNLTSIGSSAFYGCDSLESFTVPDSVMSIGNSAFDGCSTLESVVLSENSNLTSIGSSAFYGCDSLESFTVPDGVTSIGEEAFIGCYKLVEVYNLSSLPITKGGENYGYVGYYALGICTSEDTPSKLWTDENGYRFYEDGDSCYLMGYEGNATELTLPENCNGKKYAIYQRAFYGCSGITDVEFSDSVTSIGEYAFYGCNGLVSVTIGKSVTSIEEDAFSGCYRLVEVYNLSSSITVTAGTGVGYYALGVYTSKDMPSKVWTDAEGYRFFEDGDGCYLLSYHGADTALVLPADCHGKQYAIFRYAFYACDELTFVEISEGVTSIGERAFAYCTSLSSITIPDSVTSIGEGAFAYCTSLSSITIPDSVTSIGERVFTNCTSLSSIAIPDSVTRIEGGTFDSCKSLTSIKIPESVTSIGWYAFYYCTNLSSITIPESVTSIEENAFSLCVRLVEVYNLSSSITVTAGTGENGYVGYYALGVYTSKDMPSKVWTNAEGYRFYEDGDRCYLLGYYGSETASPLPADCHGKKYAINDYAFYMCYTLSSEITIPEGVTSIGELAFSYCSIDSVIFEETDGWTADGVSLSSEELTDPETATRYLKETYAGKDWTRS